MLELAIDVHRGPFHLKLDCRFAADWTVIFGPSGSGKTTVLRLVAGLEPLDQGSITLDDRVLSSRSSNKFLVPGKRSIAFVLQQPSLFPHMDVAANVAFGLTALDRRTKEMRIQEMLELVGATALTKRCPLELSGGEAQRVALARALARRPRLLLLDEPFSALDGAASDTLLARLQVWLREHSVQTVLVTHDATDALVAAADVALLKNGHLVALGPAAEVLAGERQRLIERLRGL